MLIWGGYAHSGPWRWSFRSDFYIFDLRFGFPTSKNIIYVTSNPIVPLLEISGGSYYYMAHWFQNGSECTNHLAGLKYIFLYHATAPKQYLIPEFLKHSHKVCLIIQFV